jgi:hypothetical protein
VRRRTIVGSLLALAAAVVGAGIAVGFVGEQQTTVIVSTPSAVPYLIGGGFDWELFALTLAGGGTLALALVTGVVAATTWQDVRASQRVADAAVDANAMARAEQGRRPSLNLWAEDNANKVHSQIEAENEVYVRLLVSNERGLRAARGTRVLVDQCVLVDGSVITFGTPALRWTSPEARDREEAIVVFAGASRVLDLGVLLREDPGESDALDRFLGIDQPPTKGEETRPPWVLRLALSTREKKPLARQYVREGTQIRLLVGSEESDATFFDVTVGWVPTAATDEEALRSLALVVTEAA